MIAQCWTFVIVILLVVAPGYGVVRALAPRLGRTLALAVSGPAAIGVYYMVGIWLTLLDVPVEPLTLLPLTVAMCGAGVFAELRADRWRISRVARPLLLTTAAASAMQVVIWLSGYGFPLANAGDNDGTNHGIFVSLIARTGSLAPKDVLLTDVPSGEVGSHFYPLGLHEVAAMLVRLGVADPSAAFVSLCVVLAAVSLPWGMVALCRRLFPDLPWAGPVAAVVGACIFTLSYGPIGQGLFPLVVGLAMVGGVVTVVVHSLEQGRARVLSVVALVGLFGVHSSEVALVVPAIVCVTLWPWTGMGVFWRKMLTLVLMGVGCVVLLLPVLASARVGATERYGSQVYSGDRGWAVGHVVLDYAVHDGTVIALVGVVVALAQRRVIPWLILYAVNAILIVATTVSVSPVITTLSAPWYSEPYRLAFNSSLLGLPLVGLAVAVGMQRVGAAGARVEQSQPLVRAPVAATIAALVLAVFVTESVVGLTQIRHYTVRVDQAHEDAFNFLSGKVGPDQRVLNSAVDGSSWMLALSNVNPVVGVKTSIWSTSQWKSRWYMIDHAANVAGDAKERALLAQWHVTYAFVGSHNDPWADVDSANEPWLIPMDATAMSSSPAWAVVFHNGAATVYRLTSS